jgi:hypothetical protein
VSWPVAHTKHSSNHTPPDPKQATKWKTVDLPDKIGIPCMTLSFTHKINWQASTDMAESIIHGDFADKELSNVQTLLSQHCSSSDLDALTQYIME